MSEARVCFECGKETDANRERVVPDPAKPPFDEHGLPTASMSLGPWCDECFDAWRSVNP